MEYLEIPQTDAGNAAYLINGNNIENLSMEESFLSPLKKQDNLVSHMRSKKGLDLKTPRSRTPLVDRPNSSKLPAQTEFTPLLQSVPKHNLFRSGRQNRAPQTPAFLKHGYKAKDSPALETGESYVYGDESVSSVGSDYREPPEIPTASSSTQSTPLAVVPKRNGIGLDRIGALPLREQEEVMANIEKENFGLKLKIHFLEDCLKKIGPEFNQIALKENAELKIKTMHFQRDLAHTKKMFNQAECDIEAYRVQLEDAQERIKRKQIDANMREDFENLRKGSVAKDTQLEKLRQELLTMQISNEDVVKLKDSIEDLEAELREKDRDLEAKEDNIDRLKEQYDHNSHKLADLDNELESTKRQLQELHEPRDIAQSLRNDLKQSNLEANETRMQLLRAQEDRQRAEEGLKELRDEMANKSFSTKSLSHQLKEKANKLEKDLANMRTSYNKLKEQLDNRTQEVKTSKERFEDHREASKAREQELQEEIKTLRDRNDIITRKIDTLMIQIQTSTAELRYKSEAKELLQTRHDALTTESQALQKELSKACERFQALEQRVEEERQRVLDLQLQSKADVDEWSSECDSLRRMLEETKNKFKAKEESWYSQTRELQSQKDRSEQQALGLQRTVDKLQASEDTLSGREKILQQALESEEQRHRTEEAVLERQMNELRQDVSDKRDALDAMRSDITIIKEDLRTSQRGHSASEEKTQALEDEIVVLQSMFDEQVEQISEELDITKEEAESLNYKLQAVKRELEQSETAKAKAEVDLHNLITNCKVGGVTREHLDSRLRDAESQLQRARADKQSLQDQLDDVNANLASLNLVTAEVESDRNEAASLRRDLSAAKKRETEQLTREAEKKETIRGLKQQINDLERKLHQLELSKLAADSPKSDIGSSTYKTEIIEVRRELAEAHQQMKDLRANTRDSEREAQRKYIALDKEARERIDEFQQQSEELEQEVADLRMQQEGQVASRDAAEQTIKRLRSRLQGLDKDLHAARLNQADDRTIAEERKDLHEMLKDAKLEAEDLRVQITNYDKRMQSASGREGDLRSHLKRVRDERTTQTQKVTALTLELENTQRQHERSIENLSRQQKGWEEERRSIISRVKFPNMSISSLHAADSTISKQLQLDFQENEKRYVAELKGMTKQIHWLNARFAREEGFRYALVFEKKYLLLQIEMFNACNAAKLKLLKEMGVAPEPKKQKKRPSLRTVVIIALASVRLQRLRREWAGQKKIQASLMKRVEQKKQSGKSIGGGH